MRKMYRLLLQDVRRMDSPQPDNYGEIHYTAGDIIKKQDISGGYLVWHMCSACTMW